MDEEDILPGQDWDAEIRKAVKSAHVVLVCLSQDSVSKRGYIQKEIRMVLDVADEQLEGDIFLIPLKLENCDVPDRLVRWQWVDDFQDLDRSYRRLLLALDQRRQSLGLTIVSQAEHKKSSEVSVEDDSLLPSYSEGKSSVADAPDSSGPGIETIEDKDDRIESRQHPSDRSDIDSQKKAPDLLSFTFETVTIAGVDGGGAVAS